MEDSPNQRPAASRQRKGAIAGALVCGWAVVIALNLARVAETARGEYSRHVLYLAGYLATAALLSVCAVYAAERITRRPGRATGSLPWGGVVGLLFIASYLLVAQDFRPFARRESPGASTEAAVVLVLCAVLSVLPLVGFTLSRWLAARGMRWPVLLGVAAIVLLEPGTLRQLYPGLHFWVMPTAAAVTAGTLATRRVPSLASLSLGAVQVVLAVAVWVSPPAPMDRFFLMRDGGTAWPLLATWFSADTHGDSRPGRGAWFESRRDAAPVPPSSLPRPRRDPIVILFTVDCLRADVLTTERHIARLPNMRGMRDRGLLFRRMYSPGSATVYTLTSLFSSSYFSQQYWTRRLNAQGEPAGDLWPHEDSRTRFADVLRAQGIPTYSVVPIDWMVNEVGVVRGFAHERYVHEDSRWTHRSDSLVDVLLGQLATVQGQGGPAFFYVHAVDAHDPYDLDGVHGSEFDRYLRELSLVDRQIGRIRRFLAERGLSDRATLMVSSDHGEAFGEHGTHYHQSTLYDELIRVPMLVVGPDVQRGTFDGLASLVDIGPTVLDLFGIPIPGEFMGQSLWPAFSGHAPVLTRPIVAEGRLKRALILDSGLKVIRDARNQTLEVYDLRTDPGELRNLAGVVSTDVQRAIGLLDHFFEVHRNPTPGYAPPYRR